MFTQKKLIWLLPAMHLFLYTSVISGASLPTHNLIMALDYQEAENISATLNTPTQQVVGEYPTGFGAISQCLLIALEDHNSPILASKSLVKNILDHKKLFTDFVKQNKKKLFAQYQRYPRFRMAHIIEEFQQICQYTLKSYQHVSQALKKNIPIEQISKLPKFSANQAPPLLHEHFNFELCQYILCARNPLSTDKWLIKHVDHHLCLLVPTHLLNKQTTHKKNGFTKQELTLGLQIDHLRTVTAKDIAAYKTSSELQSTKLISALNSLFIPNTSYKHTDISTPCWSFYITGHGISAYNSIDVLKQLESLNTYYSKYKATTKPNISKYIFKKLNKITSEIDKLTKQKAYLTPEHEGIIVSLPKDIFQELLLFFNNYIHTGFLFYSSCFAGGEHLVTPYTKHKKDLILNYPVVSGTLAENKSLGETPYLHLPPYSTFQLPAEAIKNNRLKLITSQHFSQFFDTLKAGKHLKKENIHDIVSLLHPYTDENKELLYSNLRNIPSYRPAGATKFSVLSNVPSFTRFDDEAKQAKRKQPFSLQTKMCLLYTNYIPYRICLEKKLEQAPLFVSMLPGLSVHVLEEIYTKQYSLQEILQSFFVFEELTAPKAFWIKKLTCKVTPELAHLAAHNQQYIVLRDIVILRNICTTDCIDTLQPMAQPMGANAVFFSNNKKNTTWNLTLQNTQVKHATMKNCRSKHYKRELLAFAPNIELYV